MVLSMVLLLPGVASAQPTWTQYVGQEPAGTPGTGPGFGDVGNWDVGASAVYNGLLYMTTSNGTGCEVWLYDTNSWFRIDPGAPGTGNGGFGDANNDVALGMAVYGNRLLVGTSNFNTGCEVWAYDGTPVTGWTRIDPGAPGPGGFGTPNNTNIYSMAILEDRLVVGTGNFFTGCEVWSYQETPGGPIWGRIDPGAPGPGNGGFGDVNNQDCQELAFFNGGIIASTWNGTSGCEVWHYNGTPVTGWSRIDPGAPGPGNGGFGDGNNWGAMAMEVFRARVQVGTLNINSGGEIWEYNGTPVTGWNRIDPGAPGPGNGGFGDVNNIGCMSTAVYNNRLFTGIENFVTGCEIWAYDGTAGTGWERVDPGAPGPGNGGFGDVNNQTASTLKVFNDRVFVGMWNPFTGCVVWGLKEPGSTSWFLAEGSTGTNEYGSFETWVLVQNPGSDPAEVDLFYQTPTSEIPGPHLTVGADTRQTVNVGDTVPDEFSVSTRVESDNPVISERAMYWTSSTGVYRQAAHDSIGVTTPARNWFLAEGSTGTNEYGSFETWVLVQNPGPDPVGVDLFFQTPTTEIAGPHLNLQPHTRQTVSVGDTVADEFSVSTRVQANMPVIAERAMYWTSVEGVYRQAAHDSIGVTIPTRTWYLAEGSTGISDASGQEGEFETWVLIQNPGGEPAEVDLFFQTPTAQVNGPHLTLPARSRQTVDVSQTVPKEFSVSTRVESNIPIIAERAMYWNAEGVYRQAAHDSIGVTSPGINWYLAEGSTGTNEYGTFETWVLIQNPGGDPAEVELFFQTPTAQVNGPHLTLGPRSRQTVNVGDFVQDQFSVSTRVESNIPIIAERAMYWNTVSGIYRQAAHDSIGFDP